MLVRSILPIETWNLREVVIDIQVTGVELGPSYWPFSLEHELFGEEYT